MTSSNGIFKILLLHILFRNKQVFWNSYHNILLHSYNFHAKKLYLIWNSYGELENKNISVNSKRFLYATLRTWNNTSQKFLLLFLLNNDLIF